ncbi:MAG: SDR family NAD(P)-dependent oxidoreductase [Alphaproteobacteria bacterium]|nr:SDR family NAD(P)-dependent oxidoreductase [Alphaproteobacteria bacterium]MCB9791490.1 SDR family NAD(P)-dependent oxidoreductase [Alphaproteobacteria bacterium]
MTEQIAVITGANSGVGFQVARQLAGQGWRVVLACRGPEKAERARAAILEEAPRAQVECMQLDVSALSSVRAFAARFAEGPGRLDLLVNNAGIAGVDEARSADGFELHLATNALGPFALTGLLLPAFAEAGGRVVNVSSLAHRIGRVDPANLNGEGQAYDPWAAYGRSKLVLLSHTLELGRRLQARGSTLRVVAAHPGFANTNIGQDSPALQPSNALGAWVQRQLERRIPTAEEAARPILQAALGSALRSGDHLGPGGWFEIAGPPAPARVAKRARDAALAKALWAASEAMTGVRYLSEP